LIKSGVNTGAFEDMKRGFGFKNAKSRALFA